MRVIRLEIRCDAYLGVYRVHGDDINEYHPMSGAWENFPAPLGDAGIMRHARHHEVCCCRKFAQFEQWWPDDVLNILAQRNLWGASYGVDVVVLKARDMFIVNGHYQSLINRDRAQEVHRIPIEQFVTIPKHHRLALLQEDYYAVE